MPSLTIASVERYLEELFVAPVRVLSLREHGSRELAGDLKAFGYGTPVFIEYEVAGARKRAVLETLSPSAFGHDHFADRAQAVLWEHSAFNGLPRHVRSLDSGAFLESGDLLSTGRAREFFLLTEFIEGTGYFTDLDRIREHGELSTLDRDRAAALAGYLAGIHAIRRDEPALYTRRIRDLLGHGECIMGLVDSYAGGSGPVARDRLRRIEIACVDWRWLIKDRTHRLCQVHGDFHPWNILFREGTDFTLLDRSRGEWGEPADDVSCMTMNYLFASLIRCGKLAGPFESLFVGFWEQYLDATGDRELAEVIAPFYAWRGLVVGSPVWYPRLPDGVREAVFRFIENVLAERRFDHRNANRYLA